MNDAWQIIYPHWRGHTRVTVNVKHETVYLIDSKWAAAQQSKRREIPFPSVESVHLPKSCSSSNRKKKKGNVIDVSTFFSLVRHSSW